jgi:hypothetical protein
MVIFLRGNFYGDLAMMAHISSREILFSSIAVKPRYEIYIYQREIYCTLVLRVCLGIPYTGHNKSELSLFYS